MLVKFILLISFVLTGAIFGLRGYLHFQIQDFANELFPRKFNTKVEKLGEDYDFVSNSFTLSLIPEKSDEKYLLKVIISTDWSEFYPIKLNLDLQSPGKDKELVSFEFSSHLNLMGQIITKFSSPFIFYKSGELDLKLNDFSVTSTLQLDTDNLNDLPHWSDVLWSNFDFSIGKAQLEHIASHFLVQSVSGKGGYFGNRTGRFEFKFDFNKDASFQLTPNNEFKIKSAVSSIELEVLDRKEIKSFFQQNKPFASFDHIMALFGNKLGLVLQTSFKAEQEGANQVYFKISTDSKNTLLQALQNTQMKLKGKLHRRFGQELLSALMYIKFLQVNPELAKQKEGVKPGIWLSPVLTVINDNSKKIMTRILEEKYFNSENSIMDLKAQAQDFKVSFNDKIFDQKVLEDFVNEQDYSKVGTILINNGHKGFKIKFMPLFNLPTGVEIGRKGKVELTSTDLAENEEQVSEKVIEQEETTQTEEIIQNTETKDSYRKTKVVSQRSKLEKPKSLFKSHHSGIWYDINRPNIKFYFYRGKNGIYYSEQFVMGNKGKAAQGTKLIFVRKTGAYQVKFPAFDTTYTVRPIEKNKMKYSFDNYVGELEKDQTHNAKIVKKYIELRNRGEI